MTVKELASLLNDREIMKEITSTEERQAADAGLVVVFGYSDDNMEFRGAVDAEIDCFGGGTVYLTANGLLQKPVCNTFIASTEEANTIKAVWHNDGDPCWTYETGIPHETFEVYEDGEVWCVGIVFSMEDLV